MFLRMKEICNTEYSNFLSLPNVNGVAIGHKIVNGIDTGSLCLTVFVEKKVDKNLLHPSEVIPFIYDGFITDVVEAGIIETHGNTTKVRPAPGGVSIGTVGSFSVGTLGCLVSTGAGTGLKTYILSNNHVIAGSNSTPIGTGILQPGDGGVNPTDLIANLSSFITVNFSGGNNIVDAAIGQVTDLSLVTNSIIDIGAPTGIASALIGGFVQKSGRTTGYTTGSITAVNGTISVNFGAPGTAIYINQIVTTPMSSPGDSGSIVLDSQNRVIGLLFSGSSSLTGVNDIREVLKSFRARLV